MAVMKPVGKLYPEIQWTYGGYNFDAHLENISILVLKSIIQPIKGFKL